VRTTIISTGEELVRGRSLDTNAPFIATELERRGFEIVRITVLGDNPEALAETLRGAAEDSALIIMTGGLGPTADDRTRAAIARAVGEDLVEDADSRRHVEERIRSFGHEPSAAHLTQALFPAGAVIFPNGNGTARGFGCHLGDAWLVAMPGVPSEMHLMFLNEVLPFLLENLTPGQKLSLDTVHIFPAPESEVDERIADLMEFGRNPSVGITVKDGIVTVSLRARCASQSEADNLVARDAAVVRERFGERAFGTGDATMPSVLSDMLEEQGATVATAESLTGGLIAHMLVGIPGISRFLMGGIVAYSNRAKTRQLGVPEEMIREHGAVSPAVAEAMARGACAAFGADLGISTTGIAGPSGGTPEKPVGLVYVGVCLHGRTHVRELNMRGDRERIKDRSALYALNDARLALLGVLDLSA
jgi:nicotinamide-nucleotide amidase